MKVKEISVTGKFERQYKKLAASLKRAAKEKESLFRNNPFDPRLDTHKLHGKDKEAWAFSISRSYRTKFIFLTSERVLFLEVGTHDIYR